MVEPPGDVHPEGGPRREVGRRVQLVGRPSPRDLPRRRVRLGEVDLPDHMGHLEESRQDPPDDRLGEDDQEEGLAPWASAAGEGEGEVVAEEDGLGGEEKD